MPANATMVYKLHSSWVSYKDLVTATAYLEPKFIITTRDLGWRALAPQSRRAGGQLNQYRIAPSPQIRVRTYPFIGDKFELDVFPCVFSGRPVIYGPVWPHFIAIPANPRCSVQWGLWWWIPYAPMPRE